MQVKIKQEPKVFNPVTLDITFETEEELSMFEHMLSWDVSIPEIVYVKDELKQVYLSKMLQTLREKVLEVQRED